MSGSLLLSGGPQPGQTAATPGAWLPPRAPRSGERAGRQVAVTRLLAGSSRRGEARKPSPGEEACSLPRQTRQRLWQPCLQASRVLPLAEVAAVLGRRRRRARPAPGLLRGAGARAAKVPALQLLPQGPLLLAGPGLQLAARVLEAALRGDHEGGAQGTRPPVAAAAPGSSGLGASPRLRSVRTAGCRRCGAARPGGRPMRGGRLIAGGCAAQQLHRGQGRPRSLPPGADRPLGPG